MGDEDQRPEERTAHPVTVSPFWIDRHEVTNAQFRAFVDATAYVTVAEKGLDPTQYPGLPPELLAPGGMVFHEPESADVRGSVAQWWAYVPGADWRHPAGPESSIEGLDNHPVVQIAHADALAYADWLGRDLPTEAEWEFAARGGLDGATYTWGDTYDPVDGWRANTWQGSFPVENETLDGHYGTAPVGCFAANGYGLLDMAGNVWEYARDFYLPGHFPEPAVDPEGPNAELSARYSPTGMPQVTIKGGSWLCAPNFCMRYRPAGRQPQEPDLGSNHIGFRTVWREVAR
jgi:formylglycine-generating enzyme required for sulfatase activity